MTEPRRRPALPRSLTGRLTAGVVALVLVVVAIVSAGTYFALRSFLYGRLDQQLATVARSHDDFRELFTPHSSMPDVGDLAPQHTWAVAIDPLGNPAVPGNPFVVPMNLTHTQRLRLLARATTDPVTLRTSDGVNLRVAVANQIVVDGVPYVVAVGLSTQDADHTIDRLLSLELAIGAIAVVVAALATGFGVRFGLRHLYRVSQTAQEVAAELSPEGAGLDRRVPVHEPGTEVGTLAESMNTLLAAVETQFAARLESENRMRQFLADASHELRTPLTSIRGYAELARMQRAVGADATEGDDNLSRIESEGTRMSRLVEDLLTLARSDQGAASIVRAPVSVDEVVDDVVASSRAAFPARRIDVSIPRPDLTVYGDHDALVRVIRNLVTNAATYTRPDGPIGVRAYADGSGVTIQVLDSGPGLPPDEAAHVFERFWRADKARSRASGGSGLGLSIVASLVQAHGGTVRFDSSVETGSTVSVWLPAPPPD